MARRLRTTSAPAAGERHEHRLRWLCRAGLIPMTDPPRPDAMKRCEELRRVRDAAARRGLSTAEQVRAVEAAMSPAEVERIDRLLAHLDRCAERWEARR